MADSGFDVYFADRRGSGLNGRQRGHAGHGLRLANDVRQLLRLVRQNHHDVPVTLLGLSWGGKIAAATAALYPNMVDRLALLYPGLHPRIKPRWWQSLQLKFARSHDIRHHPVTLPLNDPALLTDNKEHQAFINDDPLALHFVTSGFLNAGRDLDRIVKTNGTQITQPTLLMLAGRDRVINNEKTKRLVANLSTTRLTTIEYPHAAHTLEFDSQRDTFVNDLVTWLQWKQ